MHKVPTCVYTDSGKVYGVQPRSMHLREYCDDKYKLLKGTELFIKSQIQTMANSDIYFSVSSHIGMNQKQSNK